MKDIFNNNLREFTTKELATMIGLSVSQTSVVGKSLGLNYHVQSTEYGRVAMWDYSAYKELQAYVQRQKAHKKQVAMRLAEKQSKLPPKKTLEEMKAEHPLVTDERFLRLSYFPSVIPNNYYEGEKSCW